MPLPVPTLWNNPMRRVYLLWTVCIACVSADAIAQQQAGIDVFPLSRHRVFRYSYQHDTTAYSLIVSPDGAIADSGLVEYTVSDSTRSSDSTIVWGVKERRSLVHRSWNWRSPSGDPTPDTTYAVTDSNTVYMVEDLSGRHQLHCASLIWSFPLEDPAGPLFRYSDATPDTMLRTTMPYVWGFDTLILAQGLGLVQRHTYIHTNASSHNPIYYQLIVRLLEVSSGVQGEPSPLPASYSLRPNYPNPFNPTTTIKYELPTSTEVRLSVCDILGREVSVLVSGRKEAGIHEVRFDASNLSSGVYLCRLTAGSFVQTRKLLLLR
jgi:Secretion system C-terminal sorting domain